MAVTDQHWQVLVPVKPAAGAKTRLRAATGSAAAHRELVRALQSDTLAAVLAAADADGSHQTIMGVCLVGELDGWPVDRTGAGASRSGATALVLRQLPDPGQGLNAALSFAAAQVRRLEPAAALVAVMADLPSLGASDLAVVLHQAAQAHTSFVPDAAGTGTTMLLASSGQPFQPRFGVHSAAAHAGHGALALPAPLRARTDVDTVDDLRQCVQLGVGLRTSQALAGVHLDRA